MPRSEGATVVRLNERSLSDAAGVRDEVVEMFRLLSNGDRAGLLGALAVGAESRLRQAVARAVQIVGNYGEVMSLLEQWLETETDEFTRAAIEDARMSQRRPDRRKKLLTDLHDVPETHRYLYERLRHRVLNVMPGAGLSVTKLKDIVIDLPSEHQPALLAEIDYLDATFARLQRALDFIEERSRFERAKLDLVEWLEQFRRTYRVQWPAIDVRIIAPSKPVAIEAVPYLLETAFNNLFDNARQAMNERGSITVNLVVRNRGVIIEVTDSGQGLSDAAAKAAFKVPVTTKGRRDRGRGLLEVADAMKRLGGTAEVVRGVAGARVVLTFALAR
jgi:signal transduction histidine kinase